MKFGPVPVNSALGATLAHSQTLGGKRYRKGQILTEEDINAISNSGIINITVAELESDDIRENDAAQILGNILAGENIRLSIANTGRINLFAASDGLVNFNPEHINAINAVNEGITIATLNLHEKVVLNQIVATIKIIPFAVSLKDLNSVQKLASDHSFLIDILSLRARKVALLQTTLPGIKTKILDKTTAVLDAKLNSLGSQLTIEKKCEHNHNSIAGHLQDIIYTGAEVILIMGASATTDRRDVIPEGIETAGGSIDHFGMPVDPGNLLLIAHIDKIPILALPGSARSPKIGGNDLILQRLLAGLPLDATSIRSMGTGGLLKESSNRPLPRAEAAPYKSNNHNSSTKPKIAGMVMAAGKSTRMGVVNKLLAKIDGKTMISHAVQTLHKSGAKPIIVVTGYESERIREELKTSDVIFAHNTSYADGLSSSLKTGIRNIPDDCNAVIISLGDMPKVNTNHIKLLIEAYSADTGRAICTPTWNGKRGNPVLWANRFFAEMEEIEGDIGAKQLLSNNSEIVHEVEMPDNGILIDIDSPAMLTKIILEKNK